MGDVVSLVEKAALNIDQDKARKIAERMRRAPSISTTSLTS